MKTLKPVFPPAATEKYYNKRLQELVSAMERSVVWWLRAKYRAEESQIVTTATDSATDELQKEFRRLLHQWERKFRDESDGLATRFVRRVRNYSARNLQAQLEPLRRGGLGFDLKFSYMSRKERRDFKAIVNENVSLIKRIASECLGQVEGIVMRAIQDGFDLGTLTERLHHQFDVTKKRAAMIARDQTAKCTNTLSRDRLTSYGITQGIWMHTSAGKTYRDAHVEMDGEVYQLEEGCFDPHEGRKVQPAELVNCHCVCRPIIPTI